MFRATHGILLVLQKAHVCVREEGEWRMKECMCDKDTRSVCAVGIILKWGDSVCVHDQEGVSQEGKKNLHGYKERESNMYALVEARVCGCMNLSRG